MEAHVSQGGTRRFGGVNGYGHVPDPAGHRCTGAHVLFGDRSRAGLAVPGTAKRLIAPVIWDQFDAGSCTGQAMARAVAVVLGLLMTPDPMEQYRKNREIDRLSPFDKLTDSGGEPNACMRAASEWGFTPWKASPAEQEFPSDTSRVNVDSAIEDIVAARQWRFTGMVRIDDTDPTDRAMRFVQAINAGYPVCYATEVDRAFEDYTSGVMGEVRGKSLGGHYLCATGYQVTPSGLVIIESDNSWSKNWGEAGRFRSSQDFIAGTTDAYVMRLQRVLEGAGQ